MLSQQYANFATADKHKTELNRILHKMVPMSSYNITVNNKPYYIYLYQSQWNALRRILLHGHPFGFEPIPVDQIIIGLRNKYPGIRSISDSIKTSDILSVYISNGLAQDKLSELSEYARNIASAYAADGKLL